MKVLVVLIGIMFVFSCGNQKHTKVSKNYNASPINYDFMIYSDEYMFSETDTSLRKQKFIKFYKNGTYACFAKQTPNDLKLIFNIMDSVEQYFYEVKNSMINCKMVSFIDQQIIDGSSVKSNKMKSVTEWRIKIKDSIVDFEYRNFSDKYELSAPWYKLKDYRLFKDTNDGVSIRQ